MHAHNTPRLCRTLVIVCAMFLLIQSAFAGPEDGSAWTLTLSPTFALPIASGDFSANELFASAWGASLGAEYDVVFSMPLALRLGMAYSSGGFMPASGLEVPGSLSEATVLAGASTSIPLAERLSLTGFLDAGISYGMLSTGTSTAYGAARAGGGLDFSVMDSISARLDASFMYKFGLYGGLGISLGVGYRLPEAASNPASMRLLELSQLEVKNIFPIFRSYYDENPVGTVTITNSGKKAATDVRVSFLIKQYMDAAKECAHGNLLGNHFQPFLPDLQLAIDLGGHDGDGLKLLLAQKMPHFLL